MRQVKSLSIAESIANVTPSSGVRILFYSSALTGENIQFLQLTCPVMGVFPCLSFPTWLLVHLSSVSAPVVTCWLPGGN
jgi:hypothetical protein